MVLRALAFICIAAVVGLVPASAAEEPAKTLSSFRVVGYLPEYRAAGFDLVAARGISDLIVFSAEPTAAGELNLSRMEKLPWGKFATFKTRERVRLILCVGGWNRSAHFAAVANSDEKRQEFAKAAVRVCLEKRLDGLDLDWEHPKNQAEQEGYALLLDELRRAFDSHGLVLSVTIASWQKLPPKAFEAVDWVNVMSYDHPGRHSTFEAAQSDVKKLIDGGVPSGKLTLGMPFYGRDTTKRERTLTYREIVARHQPKPSVDEIDNVYFNGSDTIARKTQYALDAGLAGVMVWELGQDARSDQSLLAVILSVVDRSRK